MPNCDGSPLLLCVRGLSDPYPHQVWAVATCVDGVITKIGLFEDHDLTIPSSYLISDRVPCTTNIEEISSPINAQILSSQLAIQATQESTGEEIEVAIAAVATANEASQVTTRATIESVGEELEVEINELKNATVGFNSAGAALPDNFNSLAQTLNYTAGNLTSIVKTNGVNTWTQTYSYTGSDLTGISAWMQT